MAQVGPSTTGVLSCFDRVIFKGYLPFHGDAELNSWVDHGLRVRRKDFLQHLESRSDELVKHAKDMADAAGRPYEYHQGYFQKDAYIQKLLTTDPVTEGLIAVRCTQEVCRTVKIVHGQERPRLTYAKRPQRVLYYYYQDAIFGLMYIRVESWFPYTIQVYVNGHDWLARQLTAC